MSSRIELALIPSHAVGLLCALPWLALTLFLIPVLYSLLARFRSPRAQAGQRLSEELSESEREADLAFGKAAE
mgnify:CR=1 FL=1